MNLYENLPIKKQFDPFANSNWKMPQNQPQLQLLMDNMKSFLEHKFFKWEKDQEFQFAFPRSAFTQIDKPLINYHQPNSLEDNQEVQPLSQVQISSIKQEGTFFVESNFYSIPYKWKLNTWIYKGNTNRIQTFYKDLALVYNQLYQLPKRITSDKISLKKGIIRILKTVPNILNIIIGIRKVYDSFPDYIRIFQKHRSAQSYKICNRMKLYQYLYVPLLPSTDISNAVNQKWAKIDKEFNNKINKLLTIDVSFNKIWMQQQKQFTKMLRQKFNDQKLINDKYYEQIHSILLKVINEKKNQIPPIVLQEFIQCVFMYQTIKRNKQQEAQDIINTRKDHNQYIEDNYKVKKYCQKWKQQQMEQYMIKQQKRIHSQMIQKTAQQIRDPVFIKYCELIHDDQLLQSIKKDNPPQKVPNRQFQCPYKLFPPYEVQTVSNFDGITFVLIKQKKILVSTNHFGWKFVLYFIRWYTWTRNVMYWLFRGLWGGRLGIKVLFYCKRFNPRYCVDPNTGQLGRSKYIQWNPIISQFRQTWVDIDKDRRDFQQSPDNGFFGKTCSRIFSIFYNYVIRMIFFMVFWLLLIKPIVIIINVIMLTIISVTAIVWIPIILVIYGLWNMLIYNFDLDDRYTIQERVSQRFFPLILTPLKFLYDLGYTIFAFLGIILFHPLLAFILVLWSILRISVKTIMDFIMLGFIKCCARSPVRDTKIAWRVSGPGLSRDFYQTIREQDVYILVRAQIQRYHLRYYKQKYQKQINRIGEGPFNLVNSILKPFGTQIHAQNFTQLSSSISFYNQKLQKQYSKQVSKFPNNPGNNIRFSQSQLEKYLSRSHQILLNYISTSGDEFLYEILNVDREDGTQQLIYRLWMSIFHNQQIFEPFQDLDKRFQLINDRENDAIQKVLKTIQGDPQYKQKIVSLKFIKKNRFQEVVPIPVRGVLNTMNIYRQRQYGDSQSNVEQGLFFNYNIKDEGQNNDSIILQLSMEQLQRKFSHE